MAASRPLQLFCHAFTAGWRAPLDDLCRGFNDSGLVEASPAALVGIVGPEIGRDSLLDFWRAHCVLEPEVAFWAPVGNEYLTINAMREWSIAHPDAIVMYVHLKGAARPTPLNMRWRQGMIDHFVMKWRETLDQLDNHDAAGPFWLHWRRIFAGNFWMANASYLATLPPCADFWRGDAEDWIGYGDPKVCDVLPGYPEPEFFYWLESQPGRPLVAR